MFWRTHLGQHTGTASSAPDPQIQGIWLDPASRPLYHSHIAEKQSLSAHFVHADQDRHQARNIQTPHSLGAVCLCVCVRACICVHVNACVCVSERVSNVHPMTLCVCPCSPGFLTHCWVLTSVN